jgi:alkanesulfonate monooxygenase SsuD/methylene tetrahydromethanopterin reductase-like flavin-dependent oxidoreductase (luciferase family)
MQASARRRESTSALSACSLPRRKVRGWTSGYGRAAGLLGAEGSSTSLVGTPEQVADVLLDYHDLGITTFLIRGFDPLEDAVPYGRDVLPLTRELIARRHPRAA